MNNVIKQLDSEIIKLISAGEVIESPASVIKELVENSIDAGADSITVEIKNGGKSYIRVTDNGSGIDEKYVEEAFNKHSTSKISTIDDFNKLYTNGFRGEALSSVIAVSETSMTTKTKEQNYGISITYKNEKILEKVKVGTSDGTNIIVKNLFENVPARQKFLKSDKSEAMKITSYLVRYALAHPEVKFKYINNSKQIFQTYGTSDLMQTAKELFSEDFYNKALCVDIKINEDLSLTGLLGKNSLMYSSRKMQYIFVNGRIVHGQSIQKAIEEAYKKYIPANNFPMFFVNILVNPANVDVNIHPNKLEVKFENEQQILTQIKNAVSKQLDSSQMIAHIDNVFGLEKEDFTDIKSQYQEYKNEISEKNSEPLSTSSKLINTSDNKNPEQPPLKFEKVEVDGDYVYKIKNTDTLVKEDSYFSENANEFENKELDFKQSPLLENNSTPAPFFIPKETVTQENFSDKKATEPYFVDLTLLKYAGRIFDTYIILNDEKYMYLIDQHAAHERVLYEKFMKDFKTQEISTQGLLMPNRVTVPINLTDYSDKIIELLDKFGFDCDLFGDNIILIRSIPTYFSENQTELFVQRVFDSYLEEDAPSFDDIIINKIATKACKAAIKGLDTTVKNEEVDKLIFDLEHCENKYACPHGRPTITRLSKYEIEKFFKRIL